MSQQDRPSFSIGKLGSVLRLALRPWDWLRRLHDTLDVDDRDEGPHRQDDDRERLRVQADVIRRAFDGDIAAAAKDGRRRADDDADAAYFFRPGRALVREERLPDVIAFFERHRDDFEGGFRRDDRRLQVPGLVPVVLPARRDGEDNVLRTLEQLDAEVPPDREKGPAASPDHVLYVVGKGTYCPADEPQHPGSDGRAPHFEADPSWGRGIRVSVVDTGLWAPAIRNPASPWIDQDVVADKPDYDTYDAKAIPPYGGHGTFVAGVIKSAAPASHVQVQGALTHGGAVYESDIVEQLHEAYIEGDHPQLISISAGTHSRGDFPLIAFDALMDTLREREIDPLLIAAAGNDYGDKPFWPAAFTWAVGVGSVDPDQNVSDYSNVGSWVDVYARGRDHVNAFPAGVYACYEPANVPDVRTFDGLARWSGTSFATPIVTGLVAAEMSRTGNSSDPRKAYNAVVSGGTQRSDPRAGQITIVGPLT